jgi:17beta-estradiol 17-dehydrogenase / very-long-chain 3-oxoacyl-CoA reductase
MQPCLLNAVRGLHIQYIKSWTTPSFLLQISSTHLSSFDSSSQTRFLHHQTQIALKDLIMLSQTEKAFIFFVIVGALSLLTILYKLVHLFYPYIRAGSLQKYNKNGNAWALVTGSSDGIGQAIAYELCSKGFNIILHGRNLRKLSSVQSTLSAAFPRTQFRLFVADATASTSVNSAAIQEFIVTITDLNLTVLVNNVGGAGVLAAAFTTFAEHKSKEIDDLISLNIYFTLHLTHALLPVLARQPSALIMNTGSTSQTGMPYISVYSPTKAYINAWSNALSMELEAEGLNIEIITVMSGNTQTGQDTRAANLFRPTANTFAKAALGKVGCGRTVVTGYFWHAAQSGAMDLLPLGVQRSALKMALKPYKGKNLDS